MLLKLTMLLALLTATSAHAQNCAPPKWFNSQVLKIGAGDYVGFGKSESLGTAQKLARRELANQLVPKHGKELLARPDVKKTVNYKTYPVEEVKAALPAAVAYELVSAKELKKEVVCEVRYVALSLTKAAAAQDLKTKELPQHINLALANRIDELEKKRIEAVDETDRTEVAQVAVQSAKELAGPELTLQRMKKLYESLPPNDLVQNAFREPLLARATKLTNALKKARAATGADKAAAASNADDVAREGEKLLNAIRDYRAGEFISAFEQLHGLARNSDPAAQFVTGFMMMEAQGTKRSTVEAFQWFKRAALAGHGPAKMMLGMFYFNGLGVKVNHTEAFKWFAAAQTDGWQCTAQLTSCKKATAATSPEAE